ncbi:hypothetical protein [Legionella sp. 27cVA30]|nr:hypothetical protein [Legionella sp. 27cVA30]
MRLFEIVNSVLEHEHNECGAEVFLNHRQNYWRDELLLDLIAFL